MAKGNESKNRRSASQFAATLLPSDPLSRSNLSQVDTSARKRITSDRNILLAEHPPIPFTEPFFPRKLYLLTYSSNYTHKYIFFYISNSFVQMTGESNTLNKLCVYYNRRSYDVTFEHKILAIAYKTYDLLATASVTWNKSVLLSEIYSSFQR